MMAPMLYARRGSRILVLAAVLGGIAAAQDATHAVTYPDRVLVKLREGSGAILVDGRLQSRSGADLSAVAKRFAAADRVERCVTLPLETLDRWYREADDRLPAGRPRPGNLGLWFRLYCGDADRAHALRTQLVEQPWVQETDDDRVPFLGGFPMTPGSGDDIPPVTPDLTFLQTYDVPGPTGFGFAAAHRIAGTRGEDLRMLHAESAWRDDHEDLGSIGPWSYVVPPFTGAALQQIEHGTAVLGVWAAQRNGFGMTGMVDRAEVRLISWITTNGIANAVAHATMDARPGDVLGLIALYDLAMVKMEDFVPAEYARLDFDAILTAVTQGVIVVEAAGNGDNDLDDPRFSLRFDRSSRDSGAIMVAATEGAQMVRASYQQLRQPRRLQRLGQRRRHARLRHLDRGRR